MSKLEQIKMSRQERQLRRFSRAFRQQKVREIELGRTTVREVSLVYQVSTTAVYKWLYKYSTIRSKQERIIVERKSDTRRIKDLEARIRELEQLVGQKQIKVEFYEKMLEIAKEELGIDVKKKFGTRPWRGTGGKGKGTGGK